MEPMMDPSIFPHQGAFEVRPALPKEVKGRVDLVGGLFVKSVKPVLDGVHLYLPHNHKYTI